MNSAMLINWEQLSLVVGDELSPADEEMKDLFRLFVDDAGRRLDTLCSGANPFDRTFIAKEAHKIRGAASSFGFEQMAGLLKDVEMQAQTVAQAQLEGLVREARSLFEQSVREVRDRYPGLTAT
ncbi:MAG: Hpt domain-containing protein [Opitutaceae bacterium]|nr:Hpt domain-containing protein [Opitutaceae bacterium]